MNNKFDFPLFYWHLELTSRCALECPRCPRTGPENKHKYSLTEMPLEKLKALFTPEVLTCHVKQILLCGGQGDPIYYSKLHEFISYVKEINRNIELVIITNGSYRKQEWWQTLAGLLDENDQIIFSIDGWDQESNSKYRKGSDFSSIMTGMETILTGKAAVVWSTIIFSFNQDRLDDIEALAKAKGVNYFIRSKSTKFGPAWADETGVDQLKPRDEFLVSAGPYIKSKTIFRPFEDSHSGMYEQIQKRKAGFPVGVTNPGCKSGERGLYVDASGILYPCSWISHPYDMTLSPGQKNLWLEDKPKFNVFDRGLEAVLNDDIWEKLFETWSSREKLYSICAEKCSLRATGI